VNSISILSLLALLTTTSLSTGGVLQFAGELGNSGDVVFSGAPASGIGPVIDDTGTIWERGGSDRLNRYSPDGRLLASIEIPASRGRNDQLTRAGDLLLLHLDGKVITLPTNANTLTPLTDGIGLMSSSGFAGKVAIYAKPTLSWLDPVSGERTPITDLDSNVNAIHVTEDGTVYVFGADEVRAWKDGAALAGFPKGFRGERPQLIGEHWYSHAWHGTINRLDAAFQPDPGVVLGGASGSFIGYLPQSADIDNGRGMANVREGLFAVSGMGGVVQLISWNGDERRFEIARRIGALDRISGVAIDQSGNIWTPRGCWRWEDGAEAPLTVGDKEAEISAQPTVLGGKILCVLKTHYSDARLCRGPLIDASGWSHHDSTTLENFKLPESISGSAAVDIEGKLSLVVVERGGKAYQLAITSDGNMASPPVGITLTGLKDCTSLAWFGGQLLAADSGKIFAFEPDGRALGEMASFNSEIHIHSDGARLAVSERDAGIVHLLAKLDAEPIATFPSLKSPSHIAISGDRIVVFEEGKQQLVKLQFFAAETKPTAPVLKKLSLTKTTASHFTDDDFQPISRPGGLPFSIAVSSQFLSVKTEGELTLGIANDKDAYILNTKGDIKLPPGDWSNIRIAARVEQSTQRERFGFGDHLPIHAAFSKDPSTWQRFDLETYKDSVTARKKQIRLSFEQAVEGKASIVIEDEKTGERIRNLVSGRSFAAGTHTLVWDGLDEQGRLVAPGTYSWRGITHPGIRPEYRMNFANGGEPTTSSWGPNHSTLQDATSNGELIFCAAPVTEGGWALMALDRDGNFVQGYDHQHGLGIYKDAIAVDDQYLYCAQDGFSWGGKVDTSKSDWVADWKLSIVRYEIDSGKLVEFPDGQPSLLVDTMQVGPKSDHTDLSEFNLAGLAVSGGNLLVGSRNLNAVLVLDAKTGKRIRSIPMPGIRHLTATYAATDSGVVRLADGKRVIEAGNMDIHGITLAPNGEIFLSDRTSHQVHHFSADGKKLSSIGKPGGAYAGVYDPARMVNPAGLAFGPDGKLWVTEERWNPKRVLAWDLAKNAVAYEKFGMPHYGGDGSGFDPQNPRRWIGLGCFWDVNIDKGSARPTHIMSRDEGHIGNYHPQSYVFFRDKGRTFLCSRGKIAVISEVRDDGTIQDIAAICGTHHFAYGCDWQPPQAYIDAFYEKWPEKKEKEKADPGSDRQPWAQRGMGVLWVDRNGDGVPQKEEFDFCGDQLTFADSEWGHLQTSLTLEVPVVVGDQVKIVAITPRGFLPNGIPNYPSLDEAIATGMPVEMTPGNKRSGVATVRDRHGRFIFNSDPEMNAYAADGRHLWTYPNKWSNVHGSHDAPLPEPGVMQGTLAFLGCAPLDAESDVIFLNGNHGRCFILSTDGIYLDEAFVDVRVSYLDNEYRLGGEIFGGSFARAETDGKYYVQIGHGPYRIYELAGLKEIKRISGSIQVSAEQVASAEQVSQQRVAAEQANKTTTLPGTINWDKGGQFKTQLELSSDATHLHLTYRVEDRSPWINNGREWFKLFATGDSVDLQIGTDPNADPRRRVPAPGDKRLLIAHFEGKAIAVLYEHRKPKSTNNPIEFTSPWRAEKVDNVRRLDSAEIEIKVEGGSYSVTAKIPLADLGFAPAEGKIYRADFGVTFGNAEGTDTNLRSYWSNQSTGLVDDIPGEIMLTPNLWGELRFGSR
jgi:hypothetical protein